MLPTFPVLQHKKMSGSAGARERKGLLLLRKECKKVRRKEKARSGRGTNRLTALTVGDWRVTMKEKKGTRGRRKKGVPNETQTPKLLPSLKPQGESD